LFEPSPLASVSKLGISAFPLFTLPIACISIQHGLVIAVVIAQSGSPVLGSVLRPFVNSLEIIGFMLCLLLESVRLSEGLSGFVC